MKSIKAIVWLLAIASHLSLAAEHNIKMLNFGDTGSMVFEPAHVIANVGDTVRFIPTNTSHFSKTFLVPENAEQWTSALDQPFEITIEHEGLYLYYCPPHLMMGMVGLIQVGAPTNLDEVQAALPRLQSKVVMNQDRFNTLLTTLQQLQKSN